MVFPEKSSRIGKKFPDDDVETDAVASSVVVVIGADLHFIPHQNTNHKNVSKTGNYSSQQYSSFQYFETIAGTVTALYLMETRMCQAK
uniref:Uncharacterized protein n=1 Tax=Romanomermis culicivorax TaxID=13658 RepID=A0A915HW26_ROMCU